MREFAAVCPLAIDPCSVESRPEPEPDIACRSEKLGCLAFELTQLIDDNFMPRIALMSHTKRDLIQALENELSDHESQAFRERHCNAAISFTFDPDANLSRRRAVMADAMRALLELPDGHTGLGLRDHPDFHPILQHVAISRGNFEGPILDADSTGWLSDPTRNALRRKFRKRYETSNPIHLLMHIEIDLLPPEDAWQAEIDNAVDELERSSFDAIWVFDRTSRSIRYERRLTESTQRPA